MVDAFDSHQSVQSCSVNDEYCIDYYAQKGRTQKSRTQYYTKALQTFHKIQRMAETFGTPESVRIFESFLPFEDNFLATLLFIIVIGFVASAFAIWIGFALGWVVGYSLASKFESSQLR